ncbi:hypothetical protein B4114_1514 [Geobacillus stearothermophilus]|uniref:Uncharacterized protein n=1 Tax=Geobacillus stearothermophilus TaxID=1422 RepID=A0A150N7G1_GEOSE|nr:hypothetical protein B4114_1514 [Geobacillus stearothermophilus]
MTSTFPCNIVNLVGVYLEEKGCLKDNETPFFGRSSLVRPRR